MASAHNDEDPSIKGGAALLIIDMISTMDFEHAALIKDRAIMAARAIRALRADASRAKLPVIYVNDNYGQWTSGRQQLVAVCERANTIGAELVRLLRPRKHDIFIIKPRHSGFYATNLQALLPRLGVSRLILTGMATDMCVLFTAADAHMRDYKLWVPENCVAAPTREGQAFALRLLARHMGVNTQGSTDCSLSQWLAMQP